MPSRARAPQILEANGLRIEVHVFPNEERLWHDFRRVALAVLADARDEGSLRIAVERNLRGWYPGVVISVRQDIAKVASESVWYVLRDGRVRPPEERMDRLYNAMSDARETSVATDQALERARVVVELANRPRPPRDRQELRR